MLSLPRSQTRTCSADGLRQGARLTGKWFALWQTTVEGSENNNAEALTFKTDRSGR
jgi:hypothetical protein